MTRCSVGPLNDDGDEQPGLFTYDTSPASDWNREATAHALDELFSLARQYRSSQAYHKLLQFIGRFRFYAPFNAMLVHLQMPGAKYVASPSAWLRDYGRRIKPEARPLVILRPMGPVMFVFDVSDTEAEQGARTVPPEIEQPFEVRGGQIGLELSRTTENARRDGIDIRERQAGAQSAGEIRAVGRGRFVNFQVKERPEVEYREVPLRYELLLNGRHSTEAKYATLAHELGHLYCGHLGTPNDKWWPDRRGLGDEICEFEAESVCYLLCSRLGIDNPSDEYLAGYLKAHDETPPISFESVMKAAGLVEHMGRERLKLRKENV